MIASATRVDFGSPSGWDIRERSVRDLVVAEHDLSHLSVMSLNSDTIIKYFGSGMDAYFRFVVFTGVINMILQMITLIFALAVASDYSHQSQSLWSRLTFNFSITDGLVLRVICLLASILILLILSIVWFYRLSARSTLGTGRASGILDNCNQEIIPNDDRVSMAIKQAISPCGLTIIRMIAAAIFLALPYAYYRCQLAMQVWIVEWNVTPYDIAIPDGSTAGSIVDDGIDSIDGFKGLLVGFVGQTLMSLFFVLIDAVWRVSCSFLTSLESHKYLLSHRTSDCIKSFLCRVIMFSIFVYVQRPPISLESRAQQMVNLLSFNTVLAPFIDVITVWLYRRCSNSRCIDRCTQCCASCTGDTKGVESTFGTGGSISANSMQFNLADEYTQLLFRQYLINQCVAFVPLAPLSGIIRCLLEWWTDRIKLLRYCSVPERHGDRFFRIVVSFLIVNTLAPLLAYPNGFLWTLV
jgi:hypothetical protein